MGRDGDVGGVADDLVADVPLVVGGVALGQVQRDSEDVDVSKCPCQTTTPVFQVSPVYIMAKLDTGNIEQEDFRTMPVEAFTNLRSNVGEKESLIHCFLVQD